MVGKLKTIQETSALNRNRRKSPSSSERPGFAEINPEKLVKGLGWLVGALV